MQQHVVQPLEEMVRSVPGVSWLLVADDGSVRYGAGQLHGAVHLRDVVHPEDVAGVLAGVSATVDDMRPFVTRVRATCDLGWRDAEPLR